MHTCTTCTLVCTCTLVWRGGGGGPQLLHGLGLCRTRKASPCVGSTHGRRHADVCRMDGSSVISAKVGRQNGLLIATTLHAVWSRALQWAARRCGRQGFSLLLAPLPAGYSVRIKVTNIGIVDSYKQQQFFISKVYDFCPRKYSPQRFGLLFGTSSARPGPARQ